jgi:hypothetical protein
MTKLLVAVITFAAILASAAPVQAVSFTFSFTNVPPVGTVDGTVTGRIDGLAPTGISAATAVFVTSSPPGVFYPLSASDNILAQPNLAIFSNSFTVTSGVLTATDFGAGFTLPTGDAVGLRLGPTQFNLRTITGPNNLERSMVSFDATFVPVSEVPLPAALPLFATGLGVLNLLGWRRKKKAAG